MGDEQKLIQEQPEQEISESREQPETIQNQESNLVKHLRRELEERIKREKELIDELKRRDEILKIANIDEIAQKLNKINELEFQLQVTKNYPQFADKIDEIIKERKPNENIEETLARYIGKQQLSSIKSSVGSPNIAPNLQETDFNSLPPEEREARAKEIFKQIYGRE